MPRRFKHLEAGCLQVNLMSTSAQINQHKYTILYYTNYIEIVCHGRDCNPKYLVGSRVPYLLDHHLFRYLAQLYFVHCRLCQQTSGRNIGF